MTDHQDGFFTVINRFQIIFVYPFSMMEEYVNKGLDQCELKPDNLYPKTIEEQVQWIEHEFARIEHFRTLRIPHYDNKQIVNYVRSSLDLIDAKYFPSMKHYPQEWADVHHFRLFTFCEFVIETHGRDVLYQKLQEHSLFEAVMAFQYRSMIWHLDTSYTKVFKELEMASLSAIAVPTHTRTTRRL